MYVEGAWRRLGAIGLDAGGADEAVVPGEDAGAAASPARPQPGVAFEDFYGREFRRVVALLYPLTGSWSVAEELAQDAFLVAHRKWSRISTFDRPDFWVRRVATNRASSAYRRRRSERRALDRVGVASEADEHAGPTAADERRWLVGHVRRLPPKQAQAVALVYVEQWPASEAASILGCTESTLRTHLQRAREALRRAIDEEANHDS